MGVPALSAEPGPPTVSDLARPAPPAERPSRSRTPLLLALLALLVLAGGITAAVLATGSGGDPGGQVAAPAATTAPSEPTTGAAATSATPSPSPSPSPTPSPTPSATSEPTTTAPPAAGNPVSFVQGYYSLLPGNTAAAFAQLSAQAQAASGGRQGFESFYAGMRSVTLQSPRQTGDNTVEGTVVFERRDGSTSREPYRFVLGTGADGGPIMQSFSRL
jgi:hypothetical protein